MVALLGVGSRQTAEMCIVPEGKLGAKVSQGVSRPRASPGALYPAVQQLLASRLLCERTAAAAARPDTQESSKECPPRNSSFCRFFSLPAPSMPATSPLATPEQRCLVRVGVGPILPPPSLSFRAITGVRGGSIRACYSSSHCGEKPCWCGSLMPPEEPLPYLFGSR